jgi:hypothetical protein
MKQWFRLQGNAWPHTARVTTEVLADIGGTPVQHLSYSPDLDPCDFWAFPTFKHELGGQKFSNDTEVKQSTSTTLGKMSGNGLLHVFEKWAGPVKNVWHITLKNKQWGHSM